MIKNYHKIAGRWVQLESYRRQRCSFWKYNKEKFINISLFLIACGIMGLTISALLGADITKSINQQIYKVDSQLIKYKD
jgi:hypothetical protein